jgi:hypothetical protein
VDERVREAERRWRRTSLAEDEARWLVERLRTGEVREIGLAVAAWCGHVAAARALAEHGRVLEPPADARAWFDGVPAPRRALYEVASLDWGSGREPMPSWDFVRSRPLEVVATALVQYASALPIGDVLRALRSESASVRGVLDAMDRARRWGSSHPVPGPSLETIAAHVRARLLALALGGSASELA